MKNEFAVKVRQLKDWLPGVKKAPEYSQNAQKRKVADVRQASEELKNRLDSLSFRDPTGKIEKTDLDRYLCFSEKKKTAKRYWPDGKNGWKSISCWWRSPRASTTGNIPLKR